MENRRRSKRIEDQSKSPTTGEINTENKVARQSRSDIAKLDDKLNSIVKMLPDTKELSTKLSSLERKVDSIGRVVYGGKSKVQKIAADVEDIRSDNVENTKLMLDLSVTQDRSASLCNVILKMHDTLQSIKMVCERMHLEVFGYTSPRAEAVPDEMAEAGAVESAEAEANVSETANRIVDKHHPAMEDHVKTMEQKLANSKREPGMSIKTFARQMTTIHQEICDYGGNSSQAILKHNFIKGLGRDFDEVFLDLIHETLPTEWHLLDLDELVPVAEKYLKDNCQYASRKRKYTDSDDDSD